MATTIFSQAENMSSDALFRQKGSGYSAAIQLGLVKVTSVGEIDWVTVTKPVSTGVSAGFEMFRFDDALQATYPVFIRVDYASAGSVQALGLWFTVGVGHDGSGNLVGPSLAVMKLAPTSAITNGQTSLSYFSVANNYLNMFMNLGAASSLAATCGYFSIERTKDASGVDTAEGFLVMSTTTGAASSQWRQQVLFPTSGGTIETSIGCILPNVGTGANGSQVAIYPCFQSKGVFLNPGLNAFGYHHANITALVPISVTVYSGTHTYLPIGAAAEQFGVRSGPGGTSGSALLMRWE